MRYKRTVFDIKVDFARSHGSYVWDKNSQSEFLDLFSAFSSLPLGYNHTIFDASFDESVRQVSRIRMANNLFQSDELIAFWDAFQRYAFSDYIHITCTGALAVESAIKCALEYKKSSAPMVLAQTKGFHGINSWGFITDRYLVVGERLRHSPRNSWQNLDLQGIMKYIQTHDPANIAAVVVEPVQCTSGDIYVPPAGLVALQELCRQNDICFIVDEIQTGFGVTGKMWYSEHIGLDPDILLFGKKAQICGIIVKEKYNACLVSPVRKLEVTFDGELIDAIRATYILKAYERDDLVSRANLNSERFAGILRGKVKNYRGKGHLIAFDFDTKELRDSFFKACYDNRLLCNPTGDVSIRLRPNMAITEREMDHFESIVSPILL